MPPTKPDTAVKRLAGLAGLVPLGMMLRREQPAGLVHDFLLGPPPGFGEVAIRIAHHPLGAVVVVFDNDVDRHGRRLLMISVPPVPARDISRRYTLFI